MIGNIHNSMIGFVNTLDILQYRLLNVQVKYNLHSRHHKRQTADCFPSVFDTSRKDSSRHA